VSAGTDACHGMGNTPDSSRSTVPMVQPRAAAESRIAARRTAGSSCGVRTKAVSSINTRRGASGSTYMKRNCGPCGTQASISNDRSSPLSAESST
jgi:hypothetical protein